MECADTSSPSIKPLEVKEEAPAFSSSPQLGLSEFAMRNLFACV